MSEHESKIFDLGNIRDILTIVFKHKYLIVTTFLTIMIGVTLFAFQLKPTYESSSVLLVKFGREFASRAEVGSERSGFSVAPETIIRGEISILRSRDLLKMVIERIGPQVIYPDLDVTRRDVTPIEAALFNLSEELSIINIPGSSMVQVSFAHPDPYMAAKVVNLLVDLFKEKHLEVFSTTSTSFLESQRKEYQKKLSESEGTLATFRQKHKIFSFDEQGRLLIQQRATLDTSLKTTQAQIPEVEQKIAFIKSSRWISELPPEVRTQLAGLQQKEQELLQRYAENSRVVENVRKEIQTVKDSAKQSLEDVRQVELRRAEGELSVLRAKADGFRRQLAGVEGEIQALNARGRELQELNRETAQQEQNYKTYTQKLEESLIVDDMDRRKMVAISVVDNAQPSMIPKKTKFSKRQLIPMGFFGGLVVGITLAFFLEFLSPGMTTTMSAERRLGIPVMVAITKME